MTRAVPRNDSPIQIQPICRKFFVSMLTCLYALIITIFALIVELSPTWRTDIQLAETVRLLQDTKSVLFQIFFLFMYGLGLLYFVYCYLFMIYPGPINWLILRLSQYRRLEKLQVGWAITHVGVVQSEKVGVVCTVSSKMKVRDSLLRTC